VDVRRRLFMVGTFTDFNCKNILALIYCSFRRLYIIHCLSHTAHRTRGKNNHLILEGFRNDLRNNSWKQYVYIVFTTGRPLCYEVLPRVLARGKKLT
jgi:hypothetical protein